ncbi:hypothetical protein HYT25_02565 [Candidatus Pacearchaeota archaeon]|nr:hypothetical protein [Candidatus Pacearchaeota archaeon]
MIIPPLLSHTRLELSAKIASAGELLKDRTDGELIEEFKKWKEKYGREKCSRDIIFSLRQDNDFYAGIASVDILRERHGKKYTENLTGFPETGFRGLLRSLRAVRY